MKTIIAGPRTLNEPNVLSNAIEKHPYPITRVICGKAKGVDTLGEQWGLTNLPKDSVDYYIPNWYDEQGKFNKAAGFIRNKEMGENAEALLSIWDTISRGTHSMISIGITVGLDLSVYLVKPSNWTKHDWLIDHEYQFWNGRVKTVGFQKVRDPYGSFSNFSYQHLVKLKDGTHVLPESYYQSLKFTDSSLSDFILRQRNPFDAKKFAYKYKDQWDQDRMDNTPLLMEHVVRQKYLTHKNHFDKQFDEIGDSHILEISNKDHLWGAMPYCTKPNQYTKHKENDSIGIYYGFNLLGLIWTRLKNENI